MRHTVTLDKIQIAAPTVHMNGTSAERLIEDYQAAASVVETAFNALCAAAPNARDYYVEGPEAFGQAQREHEARAAALRKVFLELEALVLDVDSQRQERERR